MEVWNLHSRTPQTPLQPANPSCPQSISSNFYYVEEESAIDATNCSGVILGYLPKRSQNLNINENLWYTNGGNSCGPKVRRKRAAVLVTDQRRWFSAATMVELPSARHISTDLSRNVHASLTEFSAPVGSYNPSEFLSPTTEIDFSEGRRDSSGEFSALLPPNGLGMAVVEQDNRVVRLHPVFRDVGTNKETWKDKRAAIQEAQRAAKASS